MKFFKVTVLLFVLLVLLLPAAGCSGEGAGNDTGAGNGTETAVERNMSHNAAPEVDEAGHVAVAGDAARDKGANAAREQNQQQGDHNEPPVKDAETEPEITEHKKAQAVQLVITRDFGRETLVSKSVFPGEKQTVFDLLQENSQVTTAYGGGFIDSINGLKSSSGGLRGGISDWFYYVNGVFAHLGANDYQPLPGDVIWWDYHQWSNMNVYPAVIGCYPRPFAGGYMGSQKPVVIMSTGESEEMALGLKKSLESRGAVSVSVRDLDEGLLQKRPGPVIVVGQWDELNSLKWLSDFNNARGRNGTSVYFSDNKVHLLDYSGRTVRTIDGSAGVITATGAGTGDSSPLWLIAGTDGDGVRQAVDILLQQPDKISGFYGAAVCGGEVIRLPLL
jgi:hypothetical protein